MVLPRCGWVGNGVTTFASDAGFASNLVNVLGADLGYKSVATCICFHGVGYDAFYSRCLGNWLGVSGALEMYLGLELCYSEGVWRPTQP